MPSLHQVYERLPEIMSPAITLNAAIRNDENSVYPLRPSRIRVDAKMGDVEADKSMVVSWEELGRDVFYRLKIDNGDWMKPDTPETVTGAEITDRTKLQAAKGNLNSKSTTKTLFFGADMGTDAQRKDLTATNTHIITVQALSPTGAVIGEGRVKISP